MIKVNIIHFDPVIGGETTLCNALFKILKHKYTVKVIHPVHLNKKGKPVIGSNWGKIEGSQYLSYEQTHDACKEVDFIFCINAKHVKGSVKSDKRKLAQEDSDNFFGRFKEQNFIFYEHGFHTWRLYNYEKLFSDLIKNGNSIRVLTNTKMAIDFYKTKNYAAYLCRQPFDTSQYGMRKESVSDDAVKICFNSRYSSTKGPHVILKDFKLFFDKGLNFKLQFRGNISDPVSVWHTVDGVLLKDFIRSKEEIVFLNFAESISEVYDYQDYCVYAGYQTKEERGKMEYSILEAIYYEIPLIVHESVFEHFKYEEYDVTPEYLEKCFIRLNDENLDKIIKREFDTDSYVQNSKILLEDFLEKKILERFDICISSPASKGRVQTELF